IVPKNLVVGFEELNLFFHDWPENYTLNYSGHPLNDNFSGTTSLEIRHDFNRVCKIIFKSWSQEVNTAIKESTYMVGKFPAHRTILPNGNLDYLFEIPENVGWVVHLTEIAPSFEDELISRFSPTFNEDTDSLISLVSNPFPLQIPKDMQKIGVSFRTEAYHDDFFPRTKIEMRLTNFSNLMTNSIVIADVVGSVDNLTDGKQTFNEGEELRLKNFYAGLAKEWIFVHEGNELVLYEKQKANLLWKWKMI
ncbi:MAG TPA: hypothetical protein VKX31_09150, partial [Brumimicrobium sp.]|nr:hypothetical protein [Brumimicrobium sp.]